MALGEMSAALRATSIALEVPKAYEGNKRALILERRARLHFDLGDKNAALEDIREAELCSGIERSTKQKLEALKAKVDEIDSSVFHSSQSKDDPTVVCSVASSVVIADTPIGRGLVTKEPLGEGEAVLKHEPPLARVRSFHFIGN
jgi:hypothetical protein